MRRVLLLLLTIFLASGTIAGSIAHANEERAEMSLAAVGLDPGCMSTPATDAAEPEKKSSDDQKPTPAAPHGCHGHHSGVPAEALAASSEIPVGQSHAQMMAAALPPATFLGTFRPPIA
ncbi:MAG: hypothetical protein U0S50_09180 [Sphingopyxis sp.]|jgi:hypothetical protein|uniref:hypothetical protein n=1 Tax=Sphingopyxis sp. TaxID=1908224 RepID=UPI002ABBD463|nr:hypothetical protein [Sphingopyxis sp.]MDZ3831973.1 hypothetical protein [Sphingopyxis sp.]